MAYDPLNANDLNPDNPTSGPDSVVPPNKEEAVNLIRNKLENIFASEPDALLEEKEVEHANNLSRHQLFMQQLMNSGKDTVQIQTEWHRYYESLSDEDKKQVWEEFYASNQAIAPVNKAPVTVDPAQQLASHVHERAVPRKRKTTPPKRKAPPPKLTWKHHVQSLLFGLSMGFILVFILLFSFFNEVFIAPFIQPSRHDTATPIILSTSSVAPTATPEVIIPKINVEIPVDYTVTSTNENVIENDLQQGVVHYPETAVPGQLGNAAYFGHSSNNILNPGKYKFAFVLLHDLVSGDVFYLTYNHVTYAYKVFSTTIVSPSDVGVLNPIPGHGATATLITCDPPGTSINRLVVVGDQISPDPSGDVSANTQAITASQNTVLPGNGPTLWHRYISTAWGKLVTVVFVIGIILLTRRWYRGEFKDS